MQPTTLLDNLNSDFFAALSSLQPKGSPQKVLVYVESDDDISFWRSALTPFEQNQIKFDIQLPVKNSLEKGKPAVLKFATNVGHNLILCVDSDYDYLLQNRTDTSKLINNNKFIFQTYSYSIENLQCYDECLHTVCTVSTKNDKQIIDFKNLLELYSKTIFKLFSWSIYYSFKQDLNSFTISDFNDSIKILEPANISEHFTTALLGLKTRVENKIKQLEKLYPNDEPFIESCIEELKQFGIQDSNAYLFIHGHTIKDNVVLMFLKPIISHLKKEKEEEIKAKKKHDDEYLNQLNHYKKKITPIESVLNNHTEFKSCFLYQKIQMDLEEYAQNLMNVKSI